MHPRLILSLLLNREPSENASLRRYGSILRGGATAVVAKAVGMGAALVTVPLTLHQLGSERYGLWATLFSILAWLSLIDLGLTNGLLNALSEAFARQRRDLAQEYVSAAFWGLSAAATVVGLFAALVFEWLDWSQLMHIGSPAVTHEFRSAVTLAAVIFAINLPFTIVGRVFVAAQRPEVMNFWAILTSVAGVAGLGAAVLVKGGLVLLVAGFSGGQALVGVASAVWLFTGAYPDLVPKLPISSSSARRVFGVASAFFVAQISTLMLFQSGNLILAHSLGPQYVAPYQVTWLLTQYVLVPQQLIGASIWAAVGEAYAKGDIAWIRRLARRYGIAGFAVCGPLLAILLVFGDRLIELWAGAAARPSPELLEWMCLWAAELIVMQPLVAVLGGTGKLRGYSFFCVAAATAAIVGGVVAVRPFGAAGVIAAVAISYLIFALVPGAYLASKVLRDSSRMLIHA